MRYYELFEALIDFDSLYGKAFRVTANEGDPSKDGFSIVTPENASAWTDWPEAPQFKEIVKAKINQPGWLAQHKREQIKRCSLTEAPIEIQQMDYPTKQEGDPSSFRQDDQRIMNSQKALDKIKRLWSSSVCDVVLYFMDVGVEPDHALMVALHGPAWSQLTPEQKRRDNDIWKLARHNIKPTPDAITVIMTNNDGAERHPATGWTIAHRLLHILMQEGQEHGYQDKAIQAFGKRLDDQWRGAFFDIGEQYQKISSVERDRFARSASPSKSIQYILACAMGQSRACREHKLTSAPELLAEAFAQFMLRGKVTFNDLSAEVNGEIELWNNADKERALRQVNHSVHSFAEYLTRTYTEIITLAKGKVFAL